jgi:hypothetical protein
MVKRRHLITGGLAAGAAALGSAPAAAAQRDDDLPVANAIGELRRALERSVEVSPELARIREQQRTFLKANQKFPDFIEVGIAVWDDVIDWHIRHQQPLNVTRLADGRYVLTVMQTTLILRPDQAENFIGFAFDAR